MNNDWQIFLQTNGAHINEGRVEHFGQQLEESQHAMENNSISDLSHLGLIRVSGEDAEHFLQGQLSNDVRQVAESHSQLSAYCSPKGRILAIMRVFKHSDNYYLQLPSELLLSTLERLQKFIIIAKVNLTDASNEWANMGISGPDSAELLNDQLGAAPEKIDDAVQKNGITVIRIPGPHARFELHGPVEEIQSLWQAVSGSVQAVGAGPWALLDIHAGIPVIYTATQEAFVPQMVNLQAINGVSFNKGCYTGQEVVARMQYLGKLKRRMYFANVDAKSCPNPGDELYSSCEGGGQGTGKVVTAQASADGGYDLLAVIQIAVPEANEPIQLLNTEGPELSLRELPYRLETDS